MNIQAQIEKIIGARKLPNETWEVYFRMLSREGRIDPKTVVAILALLLEEATTPRDETPTVAISDLMSLTALVNERHAFYLSEIAKLKKGKEDHGGAKASKGNQVKAG